jgi:diamine N-acetyltransferase
MGDHQGGFQKGADMKIELKPVTRANWRECIRLEVAQDQKGFVAPNVGSLAESRFEPHYEPRAIYADGRMAGFAMYCPDEEEGDDGLFWIFRLMTDQWHQGRGIGRRAMECLLDEIAARGGRKVKISFVPSNTAAARLYESLGFVDAGEVEEGEIVMERDLDGRDG